MTNCTKALNLSPPFTDARDANVVGRSMRILAAAIGAETEHHAAVRTMHRSPVEQTHGRNVKIIVVQKGRCIEASRSKRIVVQKGRRIEASRTAAETADSLVVQNGICIEASQSKPWWYRQER